MFAYRLGALRLFCCLALAAITCGGPNGRAQVLVEDQASGQLGEIVSTFVAMPTNEVAQSFTPALPGIGFIQLQTVVAAFDPGSMGLMVVIQLREGGSLGPVIATTEPLFLQHLATEFTVFLFSDNVSILPNQTYAFQPMVLAGGVLDIAYKSPSSYTRGDLFINGTPSGGLGDLWFREGLVVPEPSIAWLVILAAAGLIMTKLPNRGRSR